MKLSTRAEDARRLDEVTTGYVECALWADCLPYDPHVVVGDEEHGYVIEMDGQPMPGERYDHIDEAQAAADHYNLQVDGWTGEHGGCEHLEPSPELMTYCRIDCSEFLSLAGGDVERYAQACVDGVREGFDPSEGTPYMFAGHDLWLSANGHGTGFYDRGLGHLGDRLHSAAEQMIQSHGERLLADNGDGTAVLL